MKILLIAINAKYIHSNLAVRSLRAYALAQRQGTGTAPSIDIAEYTINQTADSILRDIYRRRPDMIGFSCYIWNIRYVKELVPELRKVLPEAMIWLGGPEVSYDAVKILTELPEAAGVMKGEGEATFAELVEVLTAFDPEPDLLSRSDSDPVPQPYHGAFSGSQPDHGAFSGSQPDHGAFSGSQSHHDTTGATASVSTSTGCDTAGATASGSVPPAAALSGLPGITWRAPDGSIRENPWRPPMDMDRLPFVCGETEDLSHRIIYYESSRGCPFSCSYCLSSIDRHLRFRSLDLVRKELQFFLDHQVPQVKFVDRTFNCSRRHAMAIWKFLIAADNGITNFHFEIAADLLDEEEIALLASMRPGLVQLEIGVQSTNPDTIREIRRTMDFSLVADRVRSIARRGNIHQHLDLIAGLPYEDLRSFRRSFDDVYALKPQQLQLGFLKVLKGSFMDERRQDYRLLCGNTPPYEVLSTRWLSFGDILCLKGVEEVLELYYNSGQFTRTMTELEALFPSAFQMYSDLSEYYRRQVPEGVSLARAARYELLLGFISETISNSPADGSRDETISGGPADGSCDSTISGGPADGSRDETINGGPADGSCDSTAEKRGRTEYFRELLTYDYYLRENAKSRPAFAGEDRISREFSRHFYEEEADKHRYLTGYGEYDKNQLRRMTHLERLPAIGTVLLFDYVNRNPLTGDAKTYVISQEHEYIKSYQ